MRIDVDSGTRCMSGSGRLAWNMTMECSARRSADQGDDVRGIIVASVTD